ncbi:uncharacterized protein IL334_006904 [Kwoniella shivajii]|uniref:Ricin B lectin domain-containing protein n=1 Tax=Kwoniella shivajii TaxID=564305 RepID=A0ABZ1D7Z8_9TREE|nr:hypothetical protein IL334_006904 [Kwoniella shivajii]
MLAALIITAALAQTSLAAVQTLTSGGQCLQVSGTPANGSPVTLGSCNSANSQMTSTGQQWVISSGNNAGVQLFGTSFCLDAQTQPAPGRQVVVATCSQAASQTWYLTADNRIAITGGTQCLDLSGTNPQTQNCAPNIATQAWSPTFLFDTPTSSSSASSTASASGAAGGVVAGGAASSAASGASSVASGASSMASAGASGASSVAGAATSGAASAGSAATSGAGSVAGAATSGAGSVAGAATSAGGAATSAIGSAAGAATSAVAAGGSSSAWSRVAMVPLPVTFGVVLGAICLL